MEWDIRAAFNVDGCTRMSWVVAQWLLWHAKEDSLSMSADGKRKLLLLRSSELTSSSV